MPLAVLARLVLLRPVLVLVLRELVLLARQPGGRAQVAREPVVVGWVQEQMERQPAGPARDRAGAGGAERACGAGAGTLRSTMLGTGEGSAAPPCLAMTASTSLRVILPSRPVPRTVDGSIL